jgi:hypothetical protein
VVIPWIVMLLPATVALPLLKVPANSVALLAFLMVTVPLAILKQPVPHEVVPKFTEIVTEPAPKAPPLTDRELKEMLRLPPLVTPPTTVAGFDKRAWPT